MAEKHLSVGQADGTSLGPKDLVKLLIEINNNYFEELFIVCQNLKQPLIFGMDFSQWYKIRIDWDHTRASYLSYKGRRLTSTWHNGAMPLCVSRLTNHATNMDTTPNGLRTRLMTIITVTIPPHHMAVIPIASSSHLICSKCITTELIEMIENPLMYVEQPCLCILDTLHKSYDRYQNKCIMLAANISDDELRTDKGITICFMCVADVTEIHHNAEPTESINESNDVDIETKESAINKVVPKETLVPQNSSFKFQKDFYPKSKITLLDAELSNKSKQQLSNHLEECSDIMSKN